MAQTQDAISFANCKIELSTNGTVWSDISGFLNILKVGGGERASAEFFTADGDGPIVTVGKKGSFELSITVAYTEGATDPAATFLTQFENSAPVYIRWSPKGGNTGNWQFTTGAALITAPPLPGGDAGSADAMIIEPVVKCTTITKSVIA